MGNYFSNKNKLKKLLMYLIISIAKTPILKSVILLIISLLRKIR